MARLARCRYAGRPSRFFSLSAAFRPRVVQPLLIASWGSGRRGRRRERSARVGAERRCRSIPALGRSKTLQRFGFRNKCIAFRHQAHRLLGEPEQIFGRGAVGGTLPDPLQPVPVLRAGDGRSLSENRSGLRLRARALRLLGRAPRRCGRSAFRRHGQGQSSRGRICASTMQCASLSMVKVQSSGGFRFAPSQPVKPNRSLAMVHIAKGLV